MSSSTTLHKLLLCLLGGFTCAAALAEGIPSRLIDYYVDSGVLENPTDEPRVVFETLIEAPEGTPWIQLVFEAAHLAPGSYLVTTSLEDGEWQPLNAEHLAQWERHTCFFNGSAVWLELVAGPRTAGNFVRVQQAHVGVVGDSGGSDGDEEPLVICDGIDDRVPIRFAAVGRLLVRDPRDVRLLSGGCTGFIIDEPGGNDKCHLSAGHCFVPGVGDHQHSTVMQFNVPPSNPNCTMKHPPVEKQFAIKIQSVQAKNGVFGDDWAVFRCWPNPKTGKTTFQEQNLALKRAAGPPAKLDATAVAGYGGDGSDNNFAAKCKCKPADNTGTRHKVLQLAFGLVTDVAATSVRYTVDTCPGNSGSPVGKPRDQSVYAIHTGGVCKKNVNDNGGTRCDLQSGRQELLDAIKKCAAGTTMGDGDVNRDGVVNMEDLALLLGEWGRCNDPDSDPPYSPLADIDGNGCVGVEDLAILLANYTPA